MAVGLFALTLLMALAGARDIAAVLGLAVLLLLSLSVPVVLVAMFRPLVVDLNRNASLRVAGLLLGGLAGGGAMTAIELPSQPVDSDYYAIAAQVIAALLIALAVEGPVPPADDPRTRRDQAGAAVGIVVALLIGLVSACVAVARGAGSAGLFVATALPGSLGAVLVGAALVARLTRTTMTGQAPRASDVRSEARSDRPSRPE